MSGDGRGRHLQGRAVALALAAVLMLPAAWVVQRALRYTCFYEPNRFNPASLADDRPTYFYLDWRDGARDPGKRVFTPETKGQEPLPVLQEALALHDLLLEKPSPDLAAAFRREVEWIAVQAVAFAADSVPVWPQYETFTRYGLRGSWISALTQGQAISLLVRAAAYTGDSRYADLARAAARGLTQDGLPIVWRDGDRVFFEEFPCRPASHVMNGCLFAWLGLWDLARFDDDEVLRRKCEDWLRGFQPIIRQHELGDWTRYDVHQTRPTSPAYHQLHASLAETMAAISGDAFWVARAIRWHESARRPEERLRVLAAVASHKIGAWLRAPAESPVGLTLNH